jgi:dTMP kinase
MGGKLIVFEGGEGCGKTTQLERLSQWLTAQDELLEAAHLAGPVVVTREPGGTDLGKKLRQLLLTPSSVLEAMADRTELLLYAADRAQHVAGVLKPLLAQGALILCDRYVDSTLAYQGYGRGLSLELITQLNTIATEGLASDLTLWLDLEVEIGLARAQQRQRFLADGLDRMEQGELAFHQRIRQGFQALAQQYPEGRVRIDASPSEAVVAAQIQRVVTQYLQRWT